MATAGIEKAGRQGSMARWWLVGLLSCLFILSCTDRLILVLFIDPIRADLMITDAQAALLLGTAFGISYAVFGLPIAWLVDRSNRTVICAIAVASWSACTVMSGFASSYGMLVILRIGLAIGEAALSPVALSLIGEHFERRERTVPMAIYAGAGALGNAIAFSLGGAIDEIINLGWLNGFPLLDGLPAWRAALVLVGSPGLVLAVLFVLTTREPPRISRTASEAPISGNWTDLREEESIRRVVPFYLLYFSGNALVATFTMGVTIWYPTYLLREGLFGRANVGQMLGAANLLVGVALIALPTLISRLRNNSTDTALLMCYLVLIPTGFAFFILSLFRVDISGVALFAAAKLMLAAVASLGPLIVALTAPPLWRGRLAAVNLFTIHFIGMGFGPSVVALLATGRIFGWEGLVPAMIVFGLATLPIAWTCILLARRKLLSSSLRT